MPNQFPSDEAFDAIGQVVDRVDEPARPADSAGARLAADTTAQPVRGVDPAGLRAMRDLSAQVNRMVDPAGLRAMRDLSAQVNRMVDPAGLRAMRDLSAQVNRMVDPAGLRAMRDLSAQVNRMVDPAGLRAVRDLSAQVNRMVDPAGLDNVQDLSTQARELLAAERLRVSGDLPPLEPRLVTIEQPAQAAPARSRLPSRPSRKSVNTVRLRLSRHSAGWLRMWDGAQYACSSRGPDFPRHVGSSLRSLLWAVRDEFTPDRDGESDRTRFARILGSRSQGRLAASGAAFANDLLKRLSALAKDPHGQESEAEAVIMLTAGLLLLILPE